MEFETVRIHFLSDVLIFWHPEILLPWQRNGVTTFSSLFLKSLKASWRQLISKNNGTVYYSRLYLAIETVSCGLLLPMARMDMD